MSNLDSKIALISFNEFIISCERAFDARLGKADLVVISEEDMCVVASTKSAKLMGVEVGLPYQQIKAIVQMAGILIKIEGSEKYIRISEHIMDILSGISDSHELVSIDECFIGMGGEMENILAGLKKDILKRTGVSISIGVGETKTLAKIANRVSRVGSKDNATCIIDVSKDEHYLTIMKSEKMSDVWNISGSQVKTLTENGLVSVDEFINADANYIRSLIGTDGLIMLDELKGIKCHDLKKIKKNIVDDDRMYGEIVKSKILKEKIISINKLDVEVCKLAKSAIKTLRKKSLYARKVSIYAYEVDKKVSKDEDVIFTDINLSFASADYSIISIISEKLKHIFNNKIKYGRIEVCLSKLGSSYQQQDLFIEALEIKKGVKRRTKTSNNPCNSIIVDNERSFAYNTILKGPTFISNL